MKHSIIRSFGLLFISLIITVALGACADDDDTTGGGGSPVVVQSVSGTYDLTGNWFACYGDDGKGTGNVTGGLASFGAGTFSHTPLTGMVATDCSDVADATPGTVISGSISVTGTTDANFSDGSAVMTPPMGGTNPVSASTVLITVAGMGEMKGLYYADETATPARLYSDFSDSTATPDANGYPTELHGIDFNSKRP